MKDSTRNALIALLFCSLLPEIVPLGCSSCNCPPDLECYEPQAYVTLGSLGSTQTVSPEPYCGAPTNWSGKGEPDAIPLDAGLELADAGDSPSTDGGVP